MYGRRSIAVCRRILIITILCIAMRMAKRIRRKSTMTFPQRTRRVHWCWSSNRSCSIPPTVMCISRRNRWIICNRRSRLRATVSVPIKRSARLSYPATGWKTSWRSIWQKIRRRSAICPRPSFPVSWPCLTTKR